MGKKLILFAAVLVMARVVFAISADPLEIGVGARPMGMGKAFVAMPENFLINPSGLSGISGLNIISMSGKILEEIDYLSVGIANPFAFGTLGFGFVGSGTGSIPLTRMVGGTIEVYDATDYSNNIYMFSYAVPLKKIGFLPRFAFTDDLSVGTSLKYFTQGFSNTSGTMEGATGSGFDMDVAASYNPDAPYSLGINLQNALPASMGGKFVWDRNDEEEGIAAVLKIGGALKLLGRRGLRQMGDHDLTLTLDYDTFVSQSKSSVWHAGAEWWPFSMLALRLGLDQQSSTVAVDNNLTGGVGLRYKGFTFDYAYHQYGDISENTAHYFSLGYVGEEKEPVEWPKPVPEAKRVSFVDVPRGYWAKEAIEYLAALGIINGYPDGTFRPDRILSRAELCALLMRAKGVKGEGRETVFPDVVKGHWAAGYIAEAADRGIVNGYPDGTFRPKQSVTRAEAVKILAIFDGLKLTKAVSQPFPDIQVNHWAAPYIQAAKSAGLLKYLEGKDFEHKRDLTRAEAAEILFRTRFVRERFKK